MSIAHRLTAALLGILICGANPCLRAGTPEQWAAAEQAAMALAADQEKRADFHFRAEAWVGDLDPELGKAVKLQLFKGHEYCIAVATPRAERQRITGVVLDLDGEPVGEIQPVLDGWGFLLFFKPRRTGHYVVAMRHDAKKGAKIKPTACAIVTGYR
jgi:hypothetical protein